MSVQSEIDTLTANIAAMNEAIAAAGGTVSTIGMDGAAASIQSIPTGGGMPDDPVTTYGAVMYYSGTTADWTVVQQQSCTVTVTNAETFSTWVKQQGLGADISFETWNGYEWQVMKDMEIIRLYDLSSIGLQVGLQSPDWAMFEMRLDAIIDKTQPVVAYTLASSAELGMLADSLHSLKTWYNFSNVDIYAGAIVRFVFGTSTPTLPDYLLNGTSVESVSPIPDNITSLPNGFLRRCQSFNAPIEGLGHITTIGSFVLEGCWSFNQPLDLSSVTTVGTNFMYNCSKYNLDTSLPACTNIGNGFMSYCAKFNCPLDISAATVIGSDFLRNCPRFNQPITLGNITKINDGFLWSCEMFNQQFAIPSTVTEIGKLFLFKCSSFNQPVTIPNTVTKIGESFLSNCSSFSQPLTIPSSVTTIGSSFLSFTAFNQPITIPNTVNSIGQYFMRECKSMISTVTCEAPATVIPSQNTGYSFGTTDANASCYTIGITLAGTYASDWKTKFPDSSSSPYRKLILAS